jgi:hypothetical protein
MLAKLIHLLRLVVVALCACAPLAGPQVAEARRQTGINDAILEKDSSKSYVLPYAIVILGVTLGMLMIARPATRLDAPRQKIGDEDED